MWVTGRSGHWLLPCRGNGLGLDRAGRYPYPFFPPAQPTRARVGRNDHAERLRRAAIWIAPLPTPGPLPVKATRRSFPTTGKHLRGPALTASLRAGCVDGSAAGGACRGKRGAITTPKTTHNHAGRPSF